MRKKETRYKEIIRRSRDLQRIRDLNGFPSAFHFLDRPFPLLYIQPVFTFDGMSGRRTGERDR